jgi:hypothetical protein
VGGAVETVRSTQPITLPFEEKFEEIAGEFPKRKHARPAFARF